MTALLNNNQHRLDELLNFANGILQGGEGRALVVKHQATIETVTPVETMQLFDSLLAQGVSVEKVKSGVGKIINAFYRSLSHCEWEKPAGNHFLTSLMRENREMEKIMSELKAIVKLLFGRDDATIPDLIPSLRRQIGRLKLYDLHYIKKENILFPYLEKVFPAHRCLQLMWSFHDDFRRSIKKLEQILVPEPPDKELLTKELGKLFFAVLPIIFREEQIVFPVAYRAIPSHNWEDMMRQGTEIGWCYIEPPSAALQFGFSALSTGNRVSLGSGFLSPEQLILLFSSLPVDITFVDENDEVCFFSEVKDRIFPRSRAIIGRKVQNCHPPESVHIVNEIVDAFRQGRKDHADFRIQFRGRFVLIRYFALRDERGVYKGTIEVTQDVTDIRKLEGERRLLDWKD